MDWHILSEVKGRTIAVIHDWKLHGIGLLLHISLHTVTLFVFVGLDCVINLSVSAVTAVHMWACKIWYLNLVSLNVKNYCITFNTKM